jgi:hypothetical protein
MHFPSFLMSDELHEMYLDHLDLVQPRQPLESCKSPTKEFTATQSCLSLWFSSACSPPRSCKAA